MFVLGCVDILEYDVYGVFWGSALGGCLSSNQGKKAERLLGVLVGDVQHTHAHGTRVKKFTKYLYIWL